MNPRPYQVAFLCTVLALGWQWMIVNWAFDGNWSGLFTTGDRFALSPPVVAEGTFTLNHSYGYDGQLYHTIAHDPLDLYGTDRYLDNPRIRYPRILISALSYVLGLGKLFWIDRAYRSLLLAAFWLGVFIVASFARLNDRSAWWGLGFLALPATFASLDRQLTDLPLCALVAAALYAAIRERWILCWLALAAATLTREMGVVAIAAMVASTLFARKWRLSALLSLAAVPTVAWYVYVYRYIPTRGIKALTYRYPFASVILAFHKPHIYPALHTLLHALDVIGILGALVAFALGLRLYGRDPLAMLAFMFAIFGIAASGSPIVDYSDGYSFARANSSLFMALLLAAIRFRNVWFLTPLAMIVPRAAFTPASETYRSILHLLHR